MKSNKIVITVAMTVSMLAQHFCANGMTLARAKTNYETTLETYNTTFDRLVTPEVQNYPNQTIYANALKTYKTQLEPSFNSFIMAARTYATNLRPTNPMLASLIDAHIAYEQALFNMVTTIESPALEDAWDTAADSCIKLLYQQGTPDYIQDARDVAEEVYGELAQLYYYYPPQLYTDKIAARTIAIKNYGDKTARTYYPDLFK